MWAFRLVGPSLIARVEAERPAVGELDDEDVLLRVLAGGICGSDLPKYLGVRGVGNSWDRAKFPGPSGFPLHEIVGEVVHSFAPELVAGDRVVGWAHASVGLAEYVIARGSDVATYDVGLPPTDAVLLQPLACVLHAANRLQFEGRRVAVLGMGPIGALFAHVARCRGASHVVGVDPIERSELADSRFVDQLVIGRSAEWSDSLGGWDRPSIVIEAVGHQADTINDAISACSEDGVVFCFGIPDRAMYPMAIDGLIRKSLTLLGGVTRNRRSALSEANAYLSCHPELTSLLITHKFGLDEIETAFTTAASPMAGRLKVVLDLRANSVSRR